MSLVGRVFSNRYEIQRELAQGGMAEVYLARDRLLDRPVALKALFPEYAREPSFVERFRREAQAAANLNHPNIVAIYDWGQETGTYFIVMEYVEGRSLRDVIRHDGPIDGSHAAEIAAEIASALGFAHRTGVVHRDVKPGNVLITQSGIVKVTDFGIARAGASDGLTQTGSVMGTATYFSPEQAQGLPVDGRSDVYSLGVVLYEMVTGVAPFTGDSPVAVAYKHVREAPVPPSRRNPDIPPDLEQIILTAMAKDPDLRYQSADDLRADLLRFRRGRPLAAAPVTALLADTGTVGATMASPAVPAAAATTQIGTLAPARSRGRRAAITIVTIAVLAAIVAIVVLVSQVAGENADKVSVPGVTGLDVNEAQSKIADAGFVSQVEREQSDSVDKDKVISQDPKEAELLKKGGTVHLKVSAGAGDVVIPNVTGQNANDAKKALEDKGLNVTTDTEPSDSVPALFAIRTEPGADTTVARGSDVKMIISSGPAAQNVPNVLNLDVADAAAQIGAAGFTFRQHGEASDTVPAGKVIRTDPGPNAQAPAGSPVDVFVSTGPAQAIVPSVVGLSEKDATKAIEDNGLVARVITEPSTKSNNGKVIAQDPTDGTQVDQGTTVVITVGEFDSGSTTTTTGP
jgi:eukaryotic-like serine/threonine-protein kinase